MTAHQKPAYLFPGQGAQYAGIGKDLHDELAVVRDTYVEASDALGYDIAALSFNAPAEKINLTRHTQPVLLTHSIACMRAYHDLVGERAAAPPPTIAAGHSLGEYSALVAADALSFAAAVALVARRGELMGEFGRGEMEALMLDYDDATDLAARHHCEVAACNLPQQTVVGGLTGDLDALLNDMAARHPKARSARLKTEGAFHTCYMVEAALRFRDTLSGVGINAPKFPVLSNFTGDHHDDADAIRSRLFLQLFKPVLWHQNLLAIQAAGADLLIEFGGGIGKGDNPAAKRPNLEGMVKKTWRADPRPTYRPVINTATLAAAADTVA